MPPVPITVTHRARIVLLALVAAIACVPAPASAQLEQWLSPTLGEQLFRSDYRLTYYPDQRVRQQPAELGLFEHRLSLSIPLWQDGSDEWTLGGSVRFQDIDTRAVLPQSYERFPDELWDVRITPAYRHKFDNGWIAGGSVTIASPSDRPFHSYDELLIRAAAFLRVPHGERNAWFFTLNYSNRSEFLEGLPIPGIAYVYSPSDRFTAVIGFPFTSIQAEIVDKLSVQLVYTPVRTVRVRLNYQPFRPLRLYAGFDWDHDFYLRADRGDEDDKLYYYEKRFTGGVRFDLRHVGVELSGGWAFDRFYFEGEGWSDRTDNRVRVGAGPFVVLRVGVRF
jgi:hypothetical protein